MKDIQQALEVIRATFPATAETVTAIGLLNERVNELPYDPFFEPVSVTLPVGKKRELLKIGAEDLKAWTRHISFGTRCRMRAFEEAVLLHFGTGEALPALVLLRAHIEAAAMSAYCLEQLTVCPRSNNIEPLRELIVRTLFGTSLNRHREKSPIAELIKAFEGETIQITRAIESLDRFHYQEHADGTLVILYSLLCEFAHPNHRGVMEFMVTEEQPQGWTIRYDPSRRASSEILERALEGLLVSMRGGYAAAEMLRSWEFEEQSGEIVWQGPSPEDAHRIWGEILQRPQNGAS